MARELTGNLSISTNFGGDAETISEAFYYTLSGYQRVVLTQEVGTSEETLALGDLASIGYVLIKNLDATNYVEAGVSTGVYHVKIPASGIALCWFNGSAIYVKANTAACKIKYWIWHGTVT